MPLGAWRTRSSLSWDAAMPQVPRRASPSMTLRTAPCVMQFAETATKPIVARSSWCGRQAAISLGLGERKTFASPVFSPKSTQ